MKKSIGNESTKLVRDARKATRACFAISGGGEVLFAAASVVIRITTFWFGQIRSQTFRNMMIPSPPPIAIEIPQEVEKIPWPWPCMKCDRSEEHTSELQSQSNLVCRLLLEKKKKIQD